MKRFKKILKILLITLFVIFCGLYIAFSEFTKPKSTKAILKSYSSSLIQPKISKQSFNGFTYRKLEITSDTIKPTLVFVHGTIGSVNDFNKYLSDSLLQSKFNMVAYDRIGYNYQDKKNVQESIAFERSHLQDAIKNIPARKVILVGYSYGGPIALSVKKKVYKTVLLAPAVYSKVEPMPRVLNFYKWKLTRWLVPSIWKQAAKEKLSHKKDLQNFENDWKSTKNNVVSIHGTSDWIVPYSNSEFLKEQFPKEQFELVTIKDVGHELVWTKFDQIKQQLLNVLD